MPGQVDGNIVYVRCAIAGGAAAGINSMNKIFSCVLLVAVLLAPSVSARDNIEASPYGMVLSDLLLSFHANEVPCEDGGREAPEVCFQVDSVGVAYLAERLTALVESYAPAGLAHGEWRAANGVWAVALEFKHDAFGRLEVYLAEGMGSWVRGLVRLVGP